ncbi:uncharacterized protein A1O9_08466 [Exophiala aquamarina CBS 119918]|uniref:ARB-07466-like C-terminal domain-containing protein n=1 Tax=Exophiala aquamarina CBS 119918 TaxID=1182545 RepID=A0A072P7A7_9EURO|nr:uncharacterized protein A1O9_08466 [Exophiala aquamarina CBS 119918]KEF55716.1 hypothetical protein A1O9_08466 [Exophiala aquamarina CBS 119918]
MHAIKHILLLLVLFVFLTTHTHALSERSEVDGPCIGANSNPGVCIKTDKCTQGGGSYISNACPGTPDNIKCCTKPRCGTNDKGHCRFTSSCASGITETNKCPGPTTFKCCMPAGGGCGVPDFPNTSSGCKQMAIDGAKAIVAAFPCKIKSIGCIRKCSDPSSSDHCTGMATDMMVAEGGVSVTTGEPIAEWVMRHASALHIAYVMWGQRIWSSNRDSVKPWSEWRYQSCTKIKNCINGDRGDNTANHWDHVHVSYKS